MYPSNREKFNTRANELAGVMDDAEEWRVTTTLQLLWEVAKDSPQVINYSNLSGVQALNWKMFVAEHQ